MRNHFKLAAIFTAASVLAACSSGNQANGLLPQVAKSSHQMHSMIAVNPYTGQACGGATSILPDGGTADVNYGSCDEIGGGAGCISTCAGSGSGPSSYDPGVGMPISGPGSINKTNCITDPSNCGTQVAVYSGPPTQTVSCPSNDGSNSIPVGGTVGYANINGQGQEARSVSDINVVYGYSGVNIINGSSYYTNLTTIGWVYEDNNGAYWFQQNPNISWTYSIGVGITVGKLISVSFGINSPPGKPAVSLGSAPGKLTEDETASPCFTKGATFFPGEILA